MSEELLPCPFCRSAPELEDCRTIWLARCKCGACVLGERAPEPDGSEPEGYWKRIKGTAVTAWNTRAPTAREQALQAKIDALMLEREFAFEREREMGRLRYPAKAETSDAAFERGRQQGMLQERALWQLHSLSDEGLGKDDQGCDRN